MSDVVRSEKPKPLTVRGLRRLLNMLPVTDDEMPVEMEFDCRCAGAVAVEAQVSPDGDGFRLVISSGDGA